MQPADQTLTFATARRRFAEAMRTQGYRKIALGPRGFELLDVDGSRWPCSHRLSTYACALDLVGVDFAAEAKARMVVAQVGVSEPVRRWAGV